MGKSAGEVGFGEELQWERRLTAESGGQGMLGKHLDLARLRAQLALRPLGPTSGEVKPL